jgi:cell division protein FtsN
MMNLQPRRRTLPRQQGSTVIGLIIGLVIGLVIAVIVALAITKGGTPFTDKLGKAGKSSEPATGQVSDPNQPMYGKVVKPPVTEPAAPQPQQPQQQDPLEQLLSNLQPEPTAPRPASRPEPKPAAVPVPAAPAAAENDKFVYYLQAGAFRNPTEAENTRARLALLGFEAAVTERSTDNGLLHRVRVGPFGGLDAMNRVRAKMTENGIDVAVVRNQKQNRE